MSTKKEFRFFTIMEYKEEGEYLSKRHKEGWRFVSVSFPGIYTFESCQPEDVVYQLDYSKDGAENIAEYKQMFADCGWEHICEFVGFSYFRKPVSKMKQEEEIFNDDDSKLEMLKRVFRGRMLPLIAIFLLMICPQLAMHSSGADVISNALFVMFFLLMLVYVGIFVKAGIAYRRLKARLR